MRTRIFIFFLTLITVSSCQTPDRDARYCVLRNELNARFPVAYVESQPYNVLYVTNRAARGAAGACSNAVYGVSKGTDLRFGMCRVQVPINRAVGSLSSGSDPNADTQINFQMAQHHGLNADAFALALKIVRRRLVSMGNIRVSWCSSRGQPVRCSAGSKGPIFCARIRKTGRMQQAVSRPLKNSSPWWLQPENVSMWWCTAWDIRWCYRLWRVSRTGCQPERSRSGY
jgi:hypothetical protein